MSPSYLINRLLQMLVVMWIVATMVFVLFRMVPGDPATMILGFNATPESVAALRETLKLDEPLFTQYLDWLGGLVQGDLGNAITYGDISVVNLVLPALLRTLELAAVGLAIGVVLAIPLGVMAAMRPGSWLDRMISGSSVVAFSLPSFWLGILLILLLSVQVKVFPVAGYVPPSDSLADHLAHLALPAITVGLTTAGILTRFMRASMIEVLQEDYITAARAKGASSRRILYRHALKNASLPFVTMAALQFGLLIGGMVVIESLFAWPGIGWLLIQAVSSRDYNVVEGVVLISAGIFVLVNFCVDVLYTVLNPRIQYG